MDLSSFKAVPERLKPDGLTSIQVRPWPDWAPFDHRAALEKSSEQRSFQVLLWPFTRHLDFVHGDESPGTVRLHRHRKLAAFSLEAAGQRHLESLEVGFRVSVLESPIGNLCPLLCLDLFHEPHKPFVAASHGNLFLVPSLSEKTSTHQARAKELVATHRAGTFVANRLYQPPTSPPAPGSGPPGWASFFQLPARQGPRLHCPGDRPYVLFSLAEELALPRQDK